MTLVELMVVILILSILLGISLPVMRAGTEGRRVREAARQMQTAVNLAKGMAAETGEPAGLILDVEFFPENPTRLFARRLFFADTPLPYAGDVVGAEAYVRRTGQFGRYYADFRATDSAVLPFIVKVGDIFRFQNRDYSITGMGTAVTPPAFPGTQYVVEFTHQVNNPIIPPAPEWRPNEPYALYPEPNSLCRPSTPNGFYYRVIGFNGDSPYLSGVGEPTSWTEVVGQTVEDNGIIWQCVRPFARDQYQIIRSPERSSAMPMELPDGVAIDLSISGFGLDGELIPTWHRERPYRYPGYFIRPSEPNGFWYTVTQGGISGTSEPNWNTTPGGLTTDGTDPDVVGWRCIVPFPITVSFHPSGRLVAPSTPMDGDGNPFAMRIGLHSFPLRTLHLMVGNLENLGERNLADPTTYWISITNRSSRVTTAENATDPVDWRANTRHLLGSYCRPIGGNDLWYKVISPNPSGVSGSSEPTWPIGLGERVADGELIWQRVSRLEVAREYAQSGRAIGGR